MRVLLVSDFVPPVRGGLELHVSRLASALCDLGDEVVVATLTAAPVLSDPRVQVRVIRAASARLLPYERSDRPFHPPLPDPLARRDLAALLREFRPDVVHAHSWLGVSVPRRRSTPLVFTAHDYAQICPVRTLVRPDDEFCDGPALRKCATCGEQKYRPAVSRALAVANPAGRRLMRPDRVIAVSDAVRTALLPHARAPIDVIPNFVDDDVPAGADVDPPHGPQPYVLFAGRAERSKGLDDLLGVWADPADLPDLLVAVTTPPDDVRPQAKVSFVSLPPTRMPAAWRGAAVGLVPSRWPDPCPTVVLEALRAGVPVVGYRVGGITEMVRDGVDGFLVPMGDTSALRAAVRRLVGDDALRARMSTAARRRAGDFVTSTIVPRIRGAYVDAGRSVDARSARAVPA